MEKMIGIKIIFWGALLLGAMKYIKDKKCTQEEYKKVLGIWGLMGLIVVVICISGNTNQNPNSMWDRLVIPLSGENWMIHYGGIIPLVVIYWSLGRIYRFSEFKWLDKGWKRLVALLLILSLFQPIQEDVIKTYRSLQNGVEAIYLNRGTMTLETRGEVKQGVYYFAMNGEVVLENPSKEPVVFDLFINIPPEYQKFVGTQWLKVRPNQEEEYRLNSKSKQKLAFEYTREFQESYLEDNNHYSRSSSFEIVLKDRENIAYFEGDLMDKKMYEKDMKEAKERKGEDL